MTNLEGNATSIGTTNGDIEEDLGVGGSGRIVSDQLGLGGALGGNGGTRTAGSDLRSLVADTSEHVVDSARLQDELSEIV